MSDTTIVSIDKSLRDFFLQDRSFLDCLFHSVSNVIQRIFSKMNQHKNFIPGFIMVLHTFGRDLKWNPHIHCLISEGGYSDDAFWRNVSHFNYPFLRNAFRTALLKEMLLRIGPSFKKVSARCYLEHEHGFYVYARHRSIDKKLHLDISKEKRHTFRSFNRWRTAILSSFGYDPLICPHCKQQMIILEIYYNHHRVSLEELYENAMSRSRGGKRSSA